MEVREPIGQAGTGEVGEALFGLVVTAVRSQVRDVSLTGASALATLERTGPRRVTELAAVEGVTQPSMTALVTGLARAGLVERRPDEEDRRAVLVALTEQGAAYLRDRRRAGAEIFDQLAGKLSEEELATLGAAVPALRKLGALDSERRSAAGRGLGGGARR